MAIVRGHLIGSFLSLFPGTRQREAALAARDRVGSEDHPPLLAASLLVQEDLALMRRGEDGWRLAAASLCFPSPWSLAGKFGRPVDEIHGPVPGFGPGSRPAGPIARMFDNLRFARDRLVAGLEAMAGDPAATGRPAKAGGPPASLPQMPEPNSSSPSSQGVGRAAAPALGSGIQHFSSGSA